MKFISDKFKYCLIVCLPCAMLLSCFYIYRLDWKIWHYNYKIRASNDGHEKNILLKNTLTLLEENQKLGFLSVENIPNMFKLNANEYGVTKGFPVPFVKNIVDLRVFWIRITNSTEALHLNFDENGKIYKWRILNDNDKESCESY